MTETDHGQHYRYAYRVNLTQDDIKNGFVDVKLDPFRICGVYRVNDFALQTIVKKSLCTGERGYKDFEQDLLDIICAAKRRIEMLHEDQNKLKPQQETDISLIKNKMELLEEDIECLHMRLDDHGVPRSDGDDTYSLCGRVDQYAERYSPKALLYKELLNMLGVNGYGGAIAEIKSLREPNGIDKAEKPWVKNTGVQPECTKVCVSFGNGVFSNGHPDRFSWDIVANKSSIIEYQILDTENQAGDPEPKQELPWIKNTGVAPDCINVLAKRKDGEYCNNNNIDGLSWELRNDNYDIVEYLILE